MMARYISALIAARPGRLRDGLRLLLTTVPQVMMIDQADDGQAVLNMVTKYHPTLVLMDTNLPSDEIWQVLKRLKAESPSTRCTVIVSNSQQVRAANAAGADDILLRGFPATELLTIVEKLASAT